LADAEAAAQARHLLPPGGREPVAFGQDAVDDGRRDREGTVRAVDEPGDGRVELLLLRERDVRLEPAARVELPVPDLHGTPEALTGDVLDLRVTDQGVDGGVPQYLPHHVVGGRFQV